MSETCKLELRNISKHFNNVHANKNIDLNLRKGEILSLLGENGSGKTTLMNILLGIYSADSGEILIDGEEVKIRSPKDALAHGIGMVHQHYRLVDNFTAFENIILGVKDRLSKKESAKKARAIIDRYGFRVDLKKRISDMSISEKQEVEIVKVLYREVEILILDEPTAVLTPQETKILFTVIEKMRDDGKSIILITHKLSEVMAVSDRVSVLRKGEFVATFNTKESNEVELTSCMVGKKVDLHIERLQTEASAPVLEIRNLNIKKDDGTPAIKDLNFFLRGGQILGVAGISGCGQKELCEAIAGLRPYEGTISHYGKDLKLRTSQEIRELGIRMAFIPEDRLGLGLAPDLSVTDNLLLKKYKDSKGPFVDRASARKEAQALIERYNVVCPSPETPVKNLSGGNIQKILLGREIGIDPNVIITAYPVRGLDINSAYMIYDILNEEKEKGTAIMFVGEDLDVLLTFCDKIMVLCEGESMEIIHTKKTTKEEIGLMMTGSKNLYKEKPDKNFGIAVDSLINNPKQIKEDASHGQNF